MSSTPSTAHPHFFCRALYLLPSPNKFISRDNGATSALGISASLWGFPLRSGDFRFALGMTASALGISASLWGLPLRSGEAP